MYPENLQPSNRTLPENSNILLKNSHKQYNHFAVVKDKKNA